ncbi:MAG TPA: hypothetical protein VHS09_01845, partial [Polyangiaceae bacterium]|nr:hypothetical protein [Polyangiaceae bacterium]
MSQRNVPPPAPPSDSSAPTAQEAVQSAAARNPLAPPTPTSAFNTAELVAEAQKMADLAQPPPTSDRPSGFPQAPTAPHAFAVPGTPPMRPRSLPVPPMLPVPPGLSPPPGLGHAPPPSFGPGLAPTSGQYPASHLQAVGLRAELPRDMRAAAAHVVRSRAYAFVLDARGSPVEVGS